MPTSMNTPAGETIAREKLILYLNTGTSASAVWSPLGKRVEDSSMELDWSDSTVQDILGNTYGEMKKPVITQSFDPYTLDSGDTALAKIWETAIVDQNPQALCNMDLLVAHFYGGSASASFGERYPSSMVKPTGLGGEGGGNIEMPLDVTFGGTRQKGTVTLSSSKVIFSATA